MPFRCKKLIFSWAMPKMLRVRSIALKKIGEICSGRSKTSRTSSGGAAKKRLHIICMENGNEIGTEKIETDEPLSILHFQL